MLVKKLLPRMSVCLHIGWTPDTEMESFPWDLICFWERITSIPESNIGVCFLKRNICLSTNIMLFTLQYLITNVFSILLFILLRCLKNRTLEHADPFLMSFSTEVINKVKLSECHVKRSCPRSKTHNSSSAV